MFQSQTRRLLPRNTPKRSQPHPQKWSFNRRRDACFPATCHSAPIIAEIFVSIADATLASPQRVYTTGSRELSYVSIADATLASPQPCHGTPADPAGGRFQSQTRRLLPRNERVYGDAKEADFVSIADATLASPQQRLPTFRPPARPVSIADATLASPQPGVTPIIVYMDAAVSIADATLASPQPQTH